MTANGSIFSPVKPGEAAPPTCIGLICEGDPIVSQQSSLEQNPGGRPDAWMSKHNLYRAEDF